MFLSSLLLKSSPALLLSCADPRKELFPWFLLSTKRPAPFRAKTQLGLGAGGSAGHGRHEDLRAAEGTESSGSGALREGTPVPEGAPGPPQLPSQQSSHPHCHTQQVCEGPALGRGALQPGSGPSAHILSAQSPRGSRQSVNTQEPCSPVHYPLDEPCVFKERNTLDFKALKGEEERALLQPS